MDFRIFISFLIERLGSETVNITGMATGTSQFPSGYMVTRSNIFLKIKAWPLRCSSSTVRKLATPVASRIARGNTFPEVGMLATEPSVMSRFRRPIEFPEESIIAGLKCNFIRSEPNRERPRKRTTPIRYRADQQHSRWPAFRDACMGLEDINSPRVMALFARSMLALFLIAFNLYSMLNVGYRKSSYPAPF